MTGAPSCDFGVFHRETLPARLEGRSTKAACSDVERLGPLALSLVETGEVFTYVPQDDEITVVEGDAGARTVVQLDQASWNGLAADLDTPPAMLYTGRATSVRGKLGRFVEWEPALRSLYHGRPIYDPDSAELAALDPTSSFTVAGDRTEMAEFLEVAGYLLVRDVFSAREVATMLAGAESLRAAARPGDQGSWWGKNAAGEAVLCRVLTANRHEAFQWLHDDERLHRLVSLSPHRLGPRGRDGDEAVTVLWKNPTMVEGLSDLPWHRDCGMGGHALMCPTLIATVCLTAGGPESGELRVLPGSHRASFHFRDGTDPEAPVGVPLAAGPGDVSLHYSDVGHVSMPPTSQRGPFRISALMAFVPDASPHSGIRHYNDVLLGREDGQVEHLGLRLDPD